MKQLSKECIELIERDAYSYYFNQTNKPFADDSRPELVIAYNEGARTALTTPSIYRAANLIEATPLTDEELEKEAERLYPFRKDVVDRSYDTLQVNRRAAHIKARKMGSGWVSVEDRLPEEMGDYLVHKKNGLIIPMSYHAPFDSGKRIFQWWGFGKWVNQHSQITHWQPLPSPPKTEV
jgi:hypothetical protein